MPSERLEFTGATGLPLAGRLDTPAGRLRAQALFAHCFTCGKDSLAAFRIARGLARKGIAVLRFDFTGLGDSAGEFANTNFSSNVADLVAAADHLRRLGRPVGLLIGHSLGGAAVLAAARRIPDALGIVAIAAPSDPEHVTGLFSEALPRILSDGEAEVRLGGRSFRIQRQFLADAAEHELLREVAQLQRPLLVLHSPADEVVDLGNATRIFTAAQHPKSFIALDRASHLLSRKEDADHAADLIAAWSAPYLRRDPPLPSVTPAQRSGGG